MQQTRLAAIMFTDIVGYSRLMEQNEQRTIQILQRHNDIVLPTISEGKGEVVDAIGDGLLVIFGSAFDAVQCALRIHHTVAEQNQRVEEELRFSLRIGINIGDIWYENDRIYGNGVNVAARVQPFADPGGICITEDVYTQVANKIDVNAAPIGRPDLKNISRSIMLYRVATGLEGNAESPDGGTEAGPAEEGGTPSLDAIKERLIAEKEKISRSRERLQGAPGGSAEQSGARDSGDETQLRERPADDLGSRIESGVYRLVEGIMDRAIDRWEDMPEEKRRAAEQKLHDQGTRDRGKKPVTIMLGSGTAQSAGDHEDGDTEGEGGGGGDLGFGLTMFLGFGLGFFYFNIGWMIWPFLLVGVLPTASGMFKMIRRRLHARRARLERPRRVEQEILRTARQFDGRLTVVQAASQLDVPLDEVQSALDSMTARGYVSQNVLDNGVIEYEFPSMRQ